MTFLPTTASRPTRVFARVFAMAAAATGPRRVRVAATGHTELPRLNPAQCIPHVVLPRIFAELGKIRVRRAFCGNDRIIRHFILWTADLIKAATTFSEKVKKTFPQN